MRTVAPNFFISWQAIRARSRLAGSTPTFIGWAGSSVAVGGPESNANCARAFPYEDFGKVSKCVAGA